MPSHSAPLRMRGAHNAVCISTLAVQTVKFVRNQQFLGINTSQKYRQSKENVDILQNLRKWVRPRSHLGAKSTWKGEHIKGLEVDCVSACIRWVAWRSVRGTLEFMLSSAAVLVTCLQWSENTQNTLAGQLFLGSIQLMSEQ